MKPHSVALSSALETETRFSSSAKLIGSSACGGWPAWMCQAGFSSCALGASLRIGREERQILVHRLGDHVEIEPLGRPRLLEHEQRQALRRGVGEPLLDGEAVALGLGDLGAVLVQEQLVDEVLRRRAAQRPADPGRQRHRVGQVLAAHLVVDAERGPARGPVGLPLRLDVPARHRALDLLAGVGVDVDDGALARDGARSSAPAAPCRWWARWAGTASRWRGAPAPGWAG